MDIPFLKDPKKISKSQDFNNLTEVAPHIYIQDFSLKESFCYELIEKFEKDQRKGKGYSGRGYDDETKDTWDLHLTSLDCYQTEDKVLHSALTKSIGDFKKFIEYDGDVKFYTCPRSSFANDTGYQLQKYILENVSLIATPAIFLKSTGYSMGICVLREIFPYLLCA